MYFYIFLVLCPLFFNLPTPGFRASSYTKGTLLVLYYINRRYGGAGRGRGEFVNSFLSVEKENGFFKNNNFILFVLRAFLALIACLPN